MGCNILYTRNHPDNNDECVDLDTLCEKSDIITLHTPLNNDTKHLINDEKLDLLAEEYADEDAIVYRIPSDEPVYEIDLNTRKITPPEFLSVLEDHNAEVVWFKVDRFFDDVDLYDSTCWIQYQNELGEQYISKTVPQVLEKSNHDILYIPWVINGPVTRAVGKVKFEFTDSTNVKDICKIISTYALG